MNPPKFPLVYCVWNDACTLHGWRNVSDIEGKQTPYTTVTAGLLVHKDKDFIKIAHSSNKFGEVADVTLIPLGMVVELVKYGRLKDGKVFKFNPRKGKSKSVS